MGLRIVATNPRGADDGQVSGEGNRKRKIESGIIEHLAQVKPEQSRTRYAEDCVDIVDARRITFVPPGKQRIGNEQGHRGHEPPPAAQRPCDIANERSTEKRGGVERGVPAENMQEDDEGERDTKACDQSSRVKV